MDVAAVLQSVEERDKWRHRLDLLGASLSEVTTQRRRIQARLRKIRSELRRLAAYSEAILDGSRSVFVKEAGGASGHPRIPAR